LKNSPETFEKRSLLPAQPAQFIPLNLLGPYLTGMEFILLFIPSGLNPYRLFSRDTIPKKEAILIPA